MPRVLPRGFENFPIRTSSRHLADRFPEFFKFAPPTPGSGGRLVSGRGPRGSTVTRSAGRTSTKVVFTEYGWTDLLHEVEEYADGREAGGGLYGHIDADGTIVVVQASGCGDYTERGTNEIHMSRSRLLLFERPGVDLIGDWHTHDERAACPSEPDERGWTASIRSGLGAYVGVIVTPRNVDADNYRWAYPNVAAWVARGNKLELATIERSND